MKNLFAAASYTFNNFYNNLNTQGQMIFSTIMFLIALLCILLFITYLVQSVQTKIRLNKIEKGKNVVAKQDPKPEVKEEIETLSLPEEPVQTNQDEVSSIAKRVKDAMKEEPITLTNFEEDQERTAIISIDELMAKAKELELIEDEEPTGVNYLEKYNLEPSEIEQVASSVMKQEDTKEVKAFKVSQVISPVYGVKKEIINNNNH